LVAHIVLFRPKAALTQEDSVGFIRAIERAHADIPSVRRFYVGKRYRHGAGYEQLMSADYPYAAVIEFENREGLAAFLAHPAHAELGAWYSRAAAEALAYDYDMIDAGEVRALVDEGGR
jgi:hypothetical protein